VWAGQAVDRPWRAVVIEWSYAVLSRLWNPFGNFAIRLGPPLLAHRRLAAEDMDQKRLVDGESEPAARSFRLAAALLSFVFVFIVPARVHALSCIYISWRNFERVDGYGEKMRQDAAARAALATLSPNVFRGRVVTARDLVDRRKTNEPVSLIVFDDVEVLKGDLPRAAHDRRAFIVQRAWCDAHCDPLSEWWPPGKTFTFGVRAPPEEAVKDADAKHVIYGGRVDGTVDACDQTSLTELQLKLLNTSDDEIARLIREYPFHPPR
jgi:hypothetical protein